jgi:hypothetical protein
LVRIVPFLLIVVGLVLAYNFTQDWLDENCGDDESIVTCVSESAGEGAINGVFGAITGVAAGIISAGGSAASRIRSGIASSIKIKLPSFRFGD